MHGPRQTHPVDHDAAEIGDLYRKSRSRVKSVRFAIECGERLKAKKDSLRYGEWLSWLSANAAVLGFESRFTAAKLLGLARDVPSTAHLN